MAELTFDTSQSRPASALNLRVAAIAWRNLWRNGRRTWLGATGIAFALLILVVGQSSQQGTFSAAIDNGARLLTGHLQIQHPLYQDDPRLEHLLTDVSSIRDMVLERAGVVEASIRAQTFALASVGERSFGAQIVGVEPEREARWSTLPSMVNQGRYLEGPGEAYIGEILARNLGARVGDEIVVLGTAKEGGVAAAVATIVGTFSTGHVELDRSFVQIDLRDFRQAWDLKADEAHQIVVIADSVEGGEALAASIQGEGFVSLDWTQFMPEIKQTVEMKQIGTRLIFALLAVIVTFSVVNTFMMTVFERTREFGMLMAIGMRPGNIMLQLQIEALWLWALGVLIGLVVSLMIIVPMASIGIPLPEEAGELLAKFNIGDRIYPQFSASAVQIASIGLLAGNQIAAFVPGLKLRRMRPVEALRGAE